MFDCEHIGRQVEYPVMPLTLRDLILIDKVKQGDLESTATLIYSRTNLRWEEVYALREYEVGPIMAKVAEAVERSKLLVADVRFPA